MDALGRSYSYFYQRPERAVFYGFLAVIYGALVWVLVYLLLYLALFATHGFVSIGFSDLDKMWAAPRMGALFVVPTAVAPLEGSLRSTVTPFAIKVWVNLVIALAYGYLVSYFFTASTNIYYLLRYHVDDTEFDDVYVMASVDESGAGVAPASSGTAGEGGTVPFVSPPSVPPAAPSTSSDPST